MEKALKEFAISCPILTSLQSKAMRDRHWKELQEIVGQQFVPPPTEPTIEISALLDLELHKFVAEIDEMTEKASKEAKHEATLKSLESTWSTITFIMSFYKDTDVPLLKLEDEVVEQLESDQMAVQSIVGSRYAFFKSQASIWQGTLQNISDVSTLLIEIQRTWSYLEPLFIGSEEVRRELPDDAKIFEEVDSDVRSILLKSWKMRNVKNACNVAGLFSKLESIGEKQNQCKKISI
jgi:dynein heavy chain